MRTNLLPLSKTSVEWKERSFFQMIIFQMQNDTRLLHIFNFFKKSLIISFDFILSFFASHTIPLFQHYLFLTSFLRSVLLSTVNHLSLGFHARHDLRSLTAHHGVYNSIARRAVRYSTPPLSACHIGLATKLILSLL